eukprot:CAMPEP_0180356524 /NCGR_PEP_ID=MMETSP0989-20121125/9387_1 /TAXON_ID=697907 /ORGANISM="non described non described, Strain CCMP2293" /LENGTH=109 /DNA_ID=CAMNT_0022346597 /DNA_START=453 /DNA_END=781 /DNA_ORIENTATION=+
MKGGGDAEARLDEEHRPLQPRDLVVQRPEAVLRAAVESVQYARALEQPLLTDAKKCPSSQWPSTPGGAMKRASGSRCCDFLGPSRTFSDLQQGHLFPGSPHLSSPPLLP